MRTFSFLLMVFALTGCIKDTVDLDTLNSNPLDPDYAGPAYINIVTSDFLQTPGPNHQLVIELDRSLLPSVGAFDLHIVDLQTGFEADLPASNATTSLTYENFNLLPGVTEYCYDITVRVDFSDGPITNFCDNL